MSSSCNAFENSKNCQSFVHQRKIQINVRGEKFETYEQTLSRFPRTLLGSHTKRSRFYNASRREYYFDRDKVVFNSILFYYQSNGILSKPETVSYEMFSSELKFFQLDGNYEDTDDEINQELAAAQRRANDRLLCLSKVKRTRRNLWRFFEQPVTPAERTFQKFCLILTVLSVVCVCLETLPSVRPRNQIQVQRGNSTSHEISVNYGIVWIAVEVLFTIWFTVELVLRFMCAPHITKFMFSFNTVIDVTSISPFYFKVIFESVTQQDVDAVTCPLLKIVCLVRLLKLKRYSVSIRLLFETIIDSGEHMRLFVLCIVFNTILFSSFVYFSEGEGRSSQFTSIPSTFWFTIITLSSVGYGDYVPTSAVGKLVGTFCCIGGTVAMFCSTPVLFTEFRRSWQRYYAEMLEIKRQRGKDADEIDQVHYRTQTVRLRCQDEASQALLESRNVAYG